MKRRLSDLWISMAIFLTAVIYSFVLFLAKNTYNSTFWILYMFTITAFLIFGLQVIFVCRKDGRIILDEVLGIVTSLYFGVQFSLGGIIAMFFSGLPAVPVLICETVILNAYLIFSFVMFGVQSNSAGQNNSDRNAVRKLRFLESDILRMADEQNDPARKAALKSLAEAVHFSDVSTDPALADIESRIAENIGYLQKMLSKPDTDISSHVQMIHNLLNDRNRTAAILKK